MRSSRIAAGGSGRQEAVFDPAVAESADGVRTCTQSPRRSSTVTESPVLMKPLIRYSLLGPVRRLSRSSSLTHAVSAAAATAASARIAADSRAARARAQCPHASVGSKPTLLRRFQPSSQVYRRGLLAARAFSRELQSELQRAARGALPVADARWLPG